MPAIVIGRTETQGIQPKRNTDQNKLSGACIRRRRENMVGVNMLLAELIKFKHGLYESCGVECFEGAMLEPCLLQPRFRVARRRRTVCTCTANFNTKNSQTKNL